MNFLETVNIALCFSRPKSGIELSEKLREIAPKVNFIIEESFDLLLKAIAKVDKVDCFIIEEEYRECSSIDLIEKLQKSPRYKKSVISIFSTDLATIDKKFLELNTSYNFDFSTPINDVVSSLKKCIAKGLSPLIPKDWCVLVLDNNPEMLEVISMHLSELGHEKHELCQSVDGAKKCLVEKDYDLLLLDWNLDDGTCIDLIEFIKSAPVSKRTKESLIIVITGRDDVDDIMTLLRYGVKDHIIKPFDYIEFEDKVGYAVEKHFIK